MPRLIFQFLRDCALNCLDQLNVLRAAEVVVPPQRQVDVFRKTLDESMHLGQRRSALEYDRLTVSGFMQPLQYPRDPVVFLDMDRWNPAIYRRGLDEFQVRIRRFVQLHRIFQARASGQSSGSIPRLKRVVGLIEALSAGETSRPQRVSSIAARFNRWFSTPRLTARFASASGPSRAVRGQACRAARNSCSASFSARMCSGKVPQQPPSSLAP